MQMREPIFDVDSFARRHIGPNEGEVCAMLRDVGFDSLAALIDATVPKDIRLKRHLDLPEAQSEGEALAGLRAIAQKNKIARSFIGTGYYDCITPPVIQRNILENPGWYTATTPYQAEIAQGRPEPLLNFQQMIIDLTALDIANASMLDEATAAAEAMALCHAVAPNRKKFFVADNCHPQTIAVVQTRAKPLGIEIKIADYSRFKFDQTVFGALVQYPATDGAIYDYAGFVRQAHDAGALVVVAADMLALTLLKPPGEFGADVAVGNTQRFGVPLGFGGPHAAYFATRDHYKRYMLSPHAVGISFDETTTPRDVELLMSIFRGTTVRDFADHNLGEPPIRIPQSAIRNSKFLTHPIFNTHDTETEMLRYLKKLESRDLSLTTSMIPLGSCTMKLNATAEMLPISWPEISKLHPFAPVEQAAGYLEIFQQLEDWLAEITGFAAISLQPNAGSQGEFAGLLAIREYHASRGQADRNICLIPTSAHGTNPASAVMAGFKVVSVACLKDGDIDLVDLRAKAEEQARDLAALMVTYPSTHGVFEPTIREICDVVHAHGGQVYMDGANLNAQVGLCRPGDYGADVCHLNLHKTFCIPHGGGGPGIGPIGVAKHLVRYLPRKFILDLDSGRILFGQAETGKRPPDGNLEADYPEPFQAREAGNVSAAPWGSASILTITWMYIRLMGAEGLKRASEVAILNANYIAKRLDPHFPVLFKGKHGLVAHECIVDLRQWKSAGIEVEDAAKRLMDYGFHAPTISWPVAGTMMIEPTESESKHELDRFCEAMISIHAEIKAVAEGKQHRENNLLKNAPHTAREIASDKWDHPYSREQAAFPASWTREHKFWPAVARIDNVYGDRNLFCSCPPVEEFER